MKNRKPAPAPVKSGIPRLPSRLTQAATGKVHQSLDPKRLHITPVQPDAPKPLNPALVRPAEKRKRAQPPRRNKAK